MSLASTETIGTKDLIFKCHQPAFVKEVVVFINVRELAALVMEYITGHEDCFGAKQWHEYFGVDVVDEKLGLNPYEFYSFWFASDPLNPTKQISETHLRPILRPRVGKYISRQIPDPYSIRSLGQMIQRPRKGPPSQFLYHNTRVFNEHGRTKVKSACWIVMRREVLAQGESYSEQVQLIAALNKKSNVGYESFPSVIDIATAVFANHCMTGERLLGDPTGVEGRIMFSRAKETISIMINKSLNEEKDYHVVLGCFSARQVERKVPDSLKITHSPTDKHENVGIVPIRTFNVI